MNELVDLMTNSAQQDAQSGKVFGVVAGLVTNNKDPEKLGRVKVEFPWLSGEDESAWARLATLMAGPNRGTFFLPEPGDEVLVAFEHGDIRFPYVLGSLWNGVDEPPRDNEDGENNPRVIRSRSGHELIFNDDENGSVEIHTRDGQKILLDDTPGGESITIEDKRGNKIVIDTASDTINIESRLEINLKARIINLKADANMTLEAGGVLTLKGTLVKIN